MRIGVLLCDHVRDEFQHIGGNYDAMFTQLLRDADANIEVVCYDIINGEWPASLDECDGWMATGSRHSAYDPDEWIAQLKEFIRRLHAAAKPYVGICFGHQVLADALGGQVDKAPQGWGVGVHPTRFTSAETWMQPQQTILALQYMHQDQVLRMPAESVLLAETAHCPVAAFRVNDTMLGIQAHPEFPHEYSRALISLRRELIGAERTGAALDSLSQPSDGEHVSQWVVQFFNQVFRVPSSGGRGKFDATA